MTEARSQRPEVGKLRRSDIFVVPQAAQIASPIGAAYSGALSDNAAPGRSLGSLKDRASTKMPALTGLAGGQNVSVQGSPRPFKAIKAYSILFKGFGGKNYLFLWKAGDEKCPGTTARLQPHYQPGQAMSAYVRLSQVKKIKKHFYGLLFGQGHRNAMSLPAYVVARPKPAKCKPVGRVN